MVNLNQRGKKNPNWRGKKAGYAAKHYRVYSARGLPKRCSVCGTTIAAKFEWANLGGLNKVRTFKRMCTHCHAKSDKRIKNIRRSAR